MPKTQTQTRTQPASGSTRASAGDVSKLGRKISKKIRPGHRSFAGAEMVCIASIVAYDLFGSAQKKLPSPGPIIAALGFYALLAAAGSVSRTFAPVLTAVAWVLALAVLVTGKRGAGILKLLRDFTGLTQKL